ncbi:DegT/DnrJ/EryC1/StrS family aminotransferase [Undibacterium luofuense]|uniref:DegT/DnrJ/EryC1/StrS family aminotransferase n=1 Tax=Undibacterium luofuense TaxID=2828733 RepID=A0A941I5T6_9BURK|nr:DegT/DnrJ/EryC1/StrS family aminotransferase [Undibacterium luofuense]MBR7781164.1 DegT/DnrJ/EryC1/StrS family aminotransferase [Undibacterium luofuense]
MSHDPVYVTRPYLPPLDELMPDFREIWDSRVLTNSGPYHQALEKALAEYLEVEYVSLFCNATIALVTALQALKVSGEVVTTPYSFVATSHSLLWNNIRPVFADINPVTLNLDPDAIERAITEHTTAIMPVHCYGVPCDTEAIQKIADKYKLSVIYDAAHAFGVKRNSGNLFAEGDISVLSFHATKVFNTLEGGAIVCRTPEMKRHIDHLKNFGFVDEVTVVEAGINGKMNEMQAAIGLHQLSYLDDALSRRRIIDTRYREALHRVEGVNCMAVFKDAASNYAYFPVLINDAYPISRDALYALLRENGIFARRYFFPLISNFAMYQHFPSADPANLPVASQVARQVLCLPIYPELNDEDLQRIISLVQNPTGGNK